MNKSNRIRIALQKSGRLSEDSFNLLKCCGIKFRKKTDQLFYHSENFPVDLLLVRDDDIPNLVIAGLCDFGIVGTNVLQENFLTRSDDNLNTELALIQTLDFGTCRLAIAAPQDFPYQNLNCLAGKRIATSYPNLLRQFLNRNDISAQVIVLTGSIEIAPRLGIADLICDLVSSGATLEANNLKEISLVSPSQAVLIKTKARLDAVKESAAALFERRVAGVLHANESKYIMLHIPKAKLSSVMNLLPGAEHPTILALDGADEKVCVHAVCRENIFWETLEELKLFGASSILVMPIEKMMI